MICFKDKTFCDYNNCKNFIGCDRAFTSKEREGSIKWWGSDEAPVAFFYPEPACFVKTDNESKIDD